MNLSKLYPVRSVFFSVHGGLATGVGFVLGMTYHPAWFALALVGVLFICVSMRSITDHWEDKRIEGRANMLATDPNDPEWKKKVDEVWGGEQRMDRRLFFGSLVGLVAASQVEAAQVPKAVKDFRGLCSSDVGAGALSVNEVRALRGRPPHAFDADDAKLLKAIGDWVEMDERLTQARLKLWHQS